MNENMPLKLEEGEKFRVITGDTGNIFFTKVSKKKEIKEGDLTLDELLLLYPTLKK